MCWPLSMNFILTWRTKCKITDTQTNQELGQQWASLRRLHCAALRPSCFVSSWEVVSTPDCQHPTELCLDALLFLVEGNVAPELGISTSAQRGLPTQLKLSALPLISQEGRSSSFPLHCPVLPPTDYRGQRTALQDSLSTNRGKGPVWPRCNSVQRSHSLQRQWLSPFKELTKFLKPSAPSVLQVLVIKIGSQHKKLRNGD